MFLTENETPKGKVTAQGHAAVIELGCTSLSGPSRPSFGVGADTLQLPLTVTFMQSMVVAIFSKLYYQAGEAVLPLPTPRWPQRADQGSAPNSAFYVQDH